MRDEIEFLFRSDDRSTRHLHLSSKPAVLNYIRFADEVRGFLRADDKVPDWGCGLGQMSWFPERRGLDVTSYDVERVPSEELAIGAERIVLGTDPVLLPFPSSAFDAVLSCGVLEHVADEAGSLREIGRLLRPGGILFIYQLPQKYAYTEIANRWPGLWYHPRRYLPRTIRRKLEECKFAVVQQRRANFFPKNLTGLPRQVRHLHNGIGSLLAWIDMGVSRMPLLHLLCHSIEIVAVKER